MSVPGPAARAHHRRVMRTTISHPPPTSQPRPSPRRRVRPAAVHLSRCGAHCTQAAMRSGGLRATVRSETHPATVKSSAPSPAVTIADDRRYKILWIFPVHRTLDTASRQSIIIIQSAGNGCVYRSLARPHPARPWP